jgi:hypothetical protein
MIEYRGEDSQDASRVTQEQYDRQMQTSIMNVDLETTMQN